MSGELSITWDHLLSFSGLVLALVGVMLPLHLDNRKKAAAIVAAIDRLQTRMRIHDRRAKKDRKRLNRLERGHRIAIEAHQAGYLQGTATADAPGRSSGQ